MVRATPGGIREGVSSETTIITRKDTGTVHAAGSASSTPIQPSCGPPTMVASTAVAASPPPTRSPAIAPTVVSLRHQMPSTRSGQNEEAATANARPTTLATGSDRTVSASANGTMSASAVAIRKARTPPAPRMSCAITPATETVSPEEVERNAANAPALTSAVSSSPRVPPISLLGREITTVSVAGRPYTRPRNP